MGEYWIIVPPESVDHNDKDDRIGWEIGRNCRFSGGGGLNSIRIWQQQEREITLLRFCITVPGVGIVVERTFATPC